MVRNGENYRHKMEKIMVRNGENYGAEMEKNLVKQGEAPWRAPRGRLVAGTSSNLRPSDVSHDICMLRGSV